MDQLSLRQLVVFVARAHQRPLTELADLLGLSRETVHLELRSAIRTLSARGTAPARPAATAANALRAVQGAARDALRKGESRT